MDLKYKSGQKPEEVFGIFIFFTTPLQLDWLIGFFFKVFTYLAALSLSCGIWDLAAACGI